jgi:hypothetical protein
MKVQCIDARSLEITAFSVWELSHTQPKMAVQFAEHRMKTAQKRARSLHAGDSVEVRSLEEILATLDENGMLEGVPFMPEMGEYCGKRFEVWRRADKTCDEGRGGSIRRVTGTVHLRELRCEGWAHGGCDAGCLLFWKEAWLKELGAPDFKEGRVAPPRAAKCKLEALARAARPGPSPANGDEEIFTCQATQVHSFSTPLPWWDARQYVRDIVTRNVTLREFVRGLYIGLFNKIQHMRSRSQFGSIAGNKKKTPHMTLNLEPGDLVRIKSRQEISETLDRRGKNAGLAFRPVMVPYCGGEYRVVRRVNRIISPGSGKMLRLGGNCVILEGVVCTGDVRRFCPRMVYTYWRDIWLTKVQPETAKSTAMRNVVSISTKTPAAAPASLASQEDPAI